MTDNCVGCGKPITEGNPAYSGGGSLSYAGEWTEWRMGACCAKPLTLELFREALAAAAAPRTNP